jgi:hypothetical protein
MKKIIFIILLICTILHADEFDLVSDEEQKTALFPMTNEEIRRYFPLILPMTKEELHQYIPLIQPMLSDEELELKQQEEARAKAKALKEKKRQEAEIAKTFVKKDQLKAVATKSEKVVIEKDEFGFLDTSDDAKDAPVNME